jgi:hypothetical protein
VRLSVPSSALSRFSSLFDFSSFSSFVRFGREFKQSSKVSGQPAFVHNTMYGAEMSEQDPRIYRKVLIRGTPMYDKEIRVGLFPFPFSASFFVSLSWSTFHTARFSSPFRLLFQALVSILVKKMNQ